MKAPAFQFYAQDFLTGCTYLTNEEIGMYVKMLCKQWTDGNIPKKRLGFLVGIEWDNISDELQSKFVDYGDYVLNERLEKEREKKQKFIEKQAENGKKGGRGNKKINSETPEKSNDKTQIKTNPLENKNPNNNQKKPLEDRKLKNEKEKVIEKGKEGSGEKPKKDTENLTLIIPEDFIPIWNDWLEYRKAKKKKPYAGVKWEQIGLNKFLEMSNNDAQTGREILNQTITKNWEGLFELKDKKPAMNGNLISKND